MARPTQTVYFISALETGGAQTGMFRLLEELSPQEFELTVISLTVNEDHLIDRFPEHVSFINLDVGAKYRFDKLYPLFDLFEGADVLVCSLYHATILGRILGSVQEVPVIVNWHHNERFKNYWRRAIYSMTNRFSDAILADSFSVSEELDGIYGEKVPISTVPIAGVDMERFRPRHQVNGSSMSIGTLGTLTQQKNHDQVLAVAKRIPDAMFHIAGTGPRRSELERLIACERLSNVEIHGYVEDVPAFLNSLDIYFQPSLYEGLCITVVEAMACGLPVVGSDVGGIEETVVHDETGYLASPEDTEAFVAYIRQLLEEDNKRSSFGRAARNRVENDYSREVLAERFKAALLEAAL